MQLPLLAELLDQISMKMSGNRKPTLYISTIDLKYAFGQTALHKETSKDCVAAIVGGKATGHYCFKKSFVVSSVFTLYCCLSGPKFPPLFPWSSNTMCCNLIIYILSLVHQRGKRAKKSKDSPIQVAETPTVPGSCS